MPHNPQWLFKPQLLFETAALDPYSVVLGQLTRNPVSASAMSFLSFVLFGDLFCSQEVDCDVSISSRSATTKAKAWAFKLYDIEGGISQEVS